MLVMLYVFSIMPRDVCVFELYAKQAQARSCRHTVSVHLSVRHVREFYQNE